MTKDRCPNASWLVSQGLGAEFDAGTQLNLEHVRLLDRMHASAGVEARGTSQVLRIDVEDH